MLRKDSRGIMTNNSPSDKAICESIVGKIASLSALELTDEEREEYKQDFESLIAMFHTLDHLDATETGPADIHVIDVSQCRDDIVTAERPDIERSCPNFNSDSKLFDVPQFIDSDE